MTEGETAFIWSEWGARRCALKAKRFTDFSQKWRRLARRWFSSTENFDQLDRDLQFFSHLAFLGLAFVFSEGEE